MMRVITAERVDLGDLMTGDRFYLSEEDARYDTHACIVALPIRENLISKSFRKSVLYFSTDTAVVAELPNWISVWVNQREN